MKIRKNLALIALACGSAAYGQGGNGAGNGIINSQMNAGDDLEQESQLILRNMHQWVDTGAGKKLKGAPADYTERMQKVLSKGVAIEWMSSERFVQLYGVEKVCVNQDLAKGFLGVSPDPMSMDGNSHRRETLRRRPHNEAIERQIKALGTPYFVQCNRALFPSDREHQYRLLHHEVAGLAGVEPNEGSVQSRYFLSDQVSGKLVNVIEKRLPIVPQDEQGSVPQGSPILRCEGTPLIRPTQGTLKRRKEFVITAFADRATFVSEIVFPIGYKGQIASLWKSGRSLFDRTTHLFAGPEMAPKVRVVRQKEGLNIESDNRGVEGWTLGSGQALEIFGEQWVLELSDRQSQSISAVLRHADQKFGGLALNCHRIEKALTELEVSRYKARLQILSEQNWMRFDQQQARLDHWYEGQLYGVPLMPRQTGSRSDLFFKY